MRREREWKRGYRNKRKTGKIGRINGRIEGWREREKGDEVDERRDKRKRRV